ncbi:MAG TPA: ABC transporter permease, partial [Coriobacteriia bacterium]|nr:ABC transporter permease [Coriobacteriia bacterium]
MVGALSLKRRRDMKEQRGQFIAVFVTIVLGVMMFGASYDAYENLTISYAGTYERLAFADATVIGQGAALSDALRAVDGVGTVVTREQADVPLKVGGDVLVGRVVSVPAGEQPGVDQLDVVAGGYPGAGAGAAALVETHMADHFSLSHGDSVSVLTPVGWRDVRLTGVAVSAEYLWPARSNQEFFESPGSFGVLFVTPDVLGEVDQTQVVPQTLVLYDAGADRAAVDAEVRRVALANGASGVVLQADQPSNKGLSLDVTGFKQMSIFFPLMFLFAAGLAAYALLTRVVYSQRSVIGTLRANGFDRGTVLRHYLSYGLWLGLAGSLVGVALALPAGWEITAAYTSELGIPDTIRELRWVTPVVGIAFGVIVGLLSAWVPARAAVRLSPAEAI